MVGEGGWYIHTQGQVGVRCSINMGRIRTGHCCYHPAKPHPDTPLPSCFLGWGTSQWGSSISGVCLQGVSSPLHCGVEEVQEGSAVLAPIEAHAELGEAVPSQGSFNGLEGTCHLLPQRRPCQAGREEGIS